jgi:hypothetical protein
MTPFWLVPYNLLMARPRLLLLVFSLFLLAACSQRPAPVVTASPTPNPCTQLVSYQVAFTPRLGGYLASWPSPPTVGSTTPGRLNSQQVASRGNPALHDLGSQGPLVTSRRFSVHYSLLGTSLLAGSCDNSAAFWSLDCQDGSSRYADLWAHSDPCVWNEGNL